MTKSKEVLYDVAWVAWQVLRSSMLDKYHPKGGWTTTEGTKDNISKLRGYLLASRKGSQGHFRRLWRILNALNAVRRGYHGQGKVGSEADKQVVAFRDRVSEEYAEAKADGMAFSDWDWDEVAADLKEWKRKQPEDFDMLQSVIARAEIAEKAGKMKNRPELARFISLLKETV